MKFEKRSSGEPEVQVQEEEQKNHGKKPVIVYIFILFIVAFILMAVSFLMHQRSNSEVIGQLRQDSSTAMQEVQAVQDKNVQLTESLKRAQTQADKLQSQLEEAQQAAQSAQNQTDAMIALYTLQQEYAAQDREACQITIASMESKGLDKLLPAQTDNGDVTTPAQRYLQLKEALAS